MSAAMREPQRIGELITLFRDRFDVLAHSKGAVIEAARRWRTAPDRESIAALTDAVDAHDEALAAYLESPSAVTA